MAGAVIGALRVELGLNSVQFQNGLKEAQNGMSKFASMASAGFAAVAVAATAAAGAIAVAMGRAIDQADALGKAAQKVGLPVEELSKLQWAAKLSDVSVDELNNGMVRLSKSMSDVAAGTQGPASQAFTALGISVKNADGSMKSASQVTSEIAEKFSGFKDGVNKTALAVAIFGRAGAGMIPMLNGGADGLKKAADEAERLGIVMKTGTTDAAQEFNDNLTRLKAMMEGALIKVMAAAAPLLQSISEALVEASKNSTIFEGAADAAAGILRGMAVVVVHTVRVIRELAAAFNGLGDAFAALKNNSWDELAAAGSKFKAQYETIKKEHLAALETLKNNPLPGPRPLTINGDYKPDAPGMRKVDSAAAQKKADEISKAYDQIERAGKRVFEQTRTPAEQLTNQLGKLQDMLSVGAITWDTYSRAVQQAHEKYDKALISSKDIGRNLESSLGGMWDDFIDGTLNAADAIKKLGQSMLKMIGNKLIGGLMDNLFGGKGATGGAAGGGIIGSLLKGIGLPGFAAGGDFTGGKPILVGERGPEIITPRMAGTVIPNHDLGGGSSGGNVQVVVNNNANAQIGVTETQGPGGMRQIEILVDQALAKAVTKNSPGAQAMQNRYGLSRAAGRR